MKRSVPTTKPTAGDGEHGDGDAHKTPAPSSGDEAINPQTELAVLAPFGTAPNGEPRKRATRGILSDLPRALENLTADAFKALREVLRMDVHKVSDARLRAIVMAGGVVRGSKIRVDEGSLRVKQHNDVGEMATSDPVPTSSPTSSEQKMLEPDKWDEVLGALSGKVHRGIERIRSAEVLAALECSAKKGVCR